MDIIPVDKIPTLAVLYELNQWGPSPFDPMAVRTSVHNNKICITGSSITELQVDAIVNAASRSLLGGGDVSRAIHEAAGQRLLAECSTLGGCHTGSCKMTDAYNLPCKKVIHAVGPTYKPGFEQRFDHALRGCYQSALQLAVQHELKTIAFSAISTGVCGYADLDAAGIACSTVRAFLDGDDGQKLNKVIFVVSREKDIEAYGWYLSRFFPPEERVNESDSVMQEQSAEAEATWRQFPDAPQTDIRVNGEAPE